MDDISFKPVFLKAPITMQMELTTECNEGCEYCYNYFRYCDSNVNNNAIRILDKPKINLESQKKDDFIRYINKINQAEVFYVTLTGGEPFLRKDIIYDVIKKFNDFNIDVSINSNLSAVSQRDLVKLNDYKILNILTSLSSFNRLKHNKITNSNSYDKILRNIEFLIDNDVMVGVSMVVDKNNLEDVFKTGKFLSEFGVHSFYATPMSPTKENKEIHEKIILDKKEVIDVLYELVDLEEKYKIHTGTLEPLPHCLIFHHSGLEKFLQRSCSAGTTTATVGVDGGVRPCSHNDSVYGYLDEENLRDIWKKMSSWKNRKYIPTECQGCDAVNRCLGGCRTGAQAIGGDLNDKHYLMEGPLKLIKEAKNPIETIINKEYIIPNSLKFRKDNDGFYVLYRNPQSVAILNEAELNLVALIKKKYLNSFTPNHLIQYLELNQSQSNFLGYLVRNGILMEGEGGYKNGRKSS